VIPSSDDATCDGYDPVNNPNSASPVHTYSGRWLKKTPTGTSGLDSSTLASYMGAGTYDSIHDLVILYGGLRPLRNFNTASVTDATNITAALPTLNSLNSSILEYTPPSAVQVPTAISTQYNGSWTVVPSCQETPVIPTSRYGHSLAFNSLNKSLIVVGGYDVNGSPLTQVQTYFDGRTYTIPEVWTAFRIDSSLPSGSAGQNIPPITLGPFPCYYWSQVNVFGNSIDIALQAPPLTGFGTPPTAGIGNAASVFIPSTGYNTGFYSTFDNACINTGPISSTDPDVSKLLSGGAYIDIDRTQLGTNENLILNLTFLPLGPSNVGPNFNPLKINESAYFRIHLIKAGESGDLIRQRPQPRDRIYAATDAYPQIAQNIAEFSAPTGQIREEQIFIPLTTNPSADRIRIERYSGNAILINAGIFRLGQH